MKHLFIINPAAGNRDRTKQCSQQIRQVMEARGLSYEIVVSKAPGHCRELANQAARTGEEYRIYACGGDGTLNEVASGVVGYPNVAISVLTGGSGNDFVRLFSEPEAFKDLERLMDCEEAEFDVIRCNDDYSINICSVGLDARIGTDVSNYKRLPLLTGFRAYAVSALVNTIRGVAEHYIVEVGGEVFDEKHTLVCACNGRYYGGGFLPVPDADPADGLMDVLVVRKVSRLQVLAVIGKYKAGKYKDIPDLIRHFRTDQLKITCDKPTSVNLDGELRTAQTVEFTVAPEKIRFFYPKELTWRLAEKTTV